MSGQIQETIHVGDRDLLWTVGNLHDLVVRSNFAFLQYAKVEAGPVMGYQQGRHARLIHANADAIAGYARLRHFKDHVANAIPIANAHLVIGKSLDREVFSELAEDEVTASENAFPVAIGLDLINENGALFPTVAAEIALPVAHNIELAHHSAALHWRFPNGGTDRLAVPCHIAWEADIY